MNQPDEPDKPEEEFAPSADSKKKKKKGGTGYEHGALIGTTDGATWGVMKDGSFRRVMPVQDEQGNQKIALDPKLPWRLRRALKRAAAKETKRRRK